MATTRVQFRWDPRVRDQIRVAASAQGETLSDWLRQAAVDRWRRLRGQAIQQVMSTFATAVPERVLAAVARRGERDPAAVLSRLRSTPAHRLTEMERDALNLIEVWSVDLPGCLAKEKDA